MSIILRIVLITISLCYLLLIIRYIRRKKIQLSFCLFWIVTALLLIIAVIIPNLIENISGLLGFENASNMIFCLTIFIAFYLIFDLTMKLSKQDDINRKLIQEVSIMKMKFKDIKNDDEDKNN